MHILLLLLSLFLAAPGTAGASPPPEHKLFVVIYEVKIDGDGRIDTLKVDRVIDPLLATSPDDAINHPVEMVLPDSYLAAVRVSLNAKHYQGGPKTFYTYKFFDPSRPDRADLEPEPRN
jgi:hypothetical protein